MSLTPSMKKRMTIALNLIEERHDKFISFIKDKNGIKVVWEHKKCGTINTTPIYSFISGQGCRLKECKNEKRKKTCMKKFGAENPFQSETIKEKSRLTCKRKFGTDYDSQNLDIKKKTTDTCIKKYGTKSPTQAQEIKEKKKQTNLLRYGVESPLQNGEILNKVKETNLKKYGVKNVFQSEDIKEKIKTVNLKKYGTENVMKNSTICDKFKKSFIEKYGVSNPSQIDWVKDKKIKTSLLHYGVEYPTQSKTIQLKLQKASLEKFGTLYPIQNKDILEKREKQNLKKYGCKIPSQLKFFQEKQINSMIKHYGVPFYTQSDDYKQKYSDIQEKRHNSLRRNHSYNTSKAEEYFYSKIIEVFPKTKRQYKSKMYPFYCDFYIPELDVYVELNFNWTHGEHPFNIQDEKDTDKLKSWTLKARKLNSTFYKEAGETWIISDPYKQAVAKINNLNYYAVYTEEEADNLLFNLKADYRKNNKICIPTFYEVGKYF